MKKIIVTQKEIYDATRPSIQKNKKKYVRKAKHKNARDYGNKQSLSLEPRGSFFLQKFAKKMILCN